MILISGASGFLGKVLVNVLGSNIITIGRNTDSNIVVDLTNSVPELPSVDLVIHCAGKAHSIPKTAVEKQEFYDVNVIGTQNLLKGLDMVGHTKQFVFISSVSVYGLESGQNISELYPLAAKDPYGRSKIEAEQLVQKWCNENQVVCTILRLPLLVGENAPGNLGAMVKAIKKGFYFNIGGGKAKKSMVLAEDVARFIPIVAPIGGVYNLTDGLHPDFKTLSKAICFSLYKKQAPNLPLSLARMIGKAGDLLGSKAPINSLKLKKITTDLIFDDSKARKLLNWEPQSVIEYIHKNCI